MHSLRGGHVFSRRPLHQERKRNQQGDNHAQHEECADERQHVGLRVDDLLQLRQCVMSGCRHAAAAANGSLLQCRQVSIEEEVAVMQVRGQLGAADLAVARKVRDQERYADRTAKVAHEVADA